MAIFYFIRQNTAFAKKISDKNKYCIKIYSVYDFSCFFFYFTLLSMAKQKIYYIEYKATYSGWVTIKASSKKEAIKIFTEDSNQDELLKDLNNEPDSIELTSLEEK